jgi:hypothetical protein
MLGALASLLLVVSCGALEEERPAVLDTLKRPDPVDPSRVVPWPKEDVDDLASASTAQQHSWTRAGEQLLADGKVAVLMLAGGLGTRAQRDVLTPKGTLDLQLPSGRSLFAMHAGRLLALRRRMRGGGGQRPPLLPLLVMTSPALHGATLRHFERHRFFGLGASTVRFFNQSTLPGLDADGAPLPDGARAPDGHGGLWTALAGSSSPSIVPELRRAGIEQIFACIVDNPLAALADPLFLGFAQARRAEMAFKVVRRRSPDEPTGMLLGQLPAAAAGAAAVAGAAAAGKHGEGGEGGKGGEGGQQQAKAKAKAKGQVKAKHDYMIYHSLPAGVSAARRGAELLHSLADTMMLVMSMPFVERMCALSAARDAGLPFHKVVRKTRLGAAVAGAVEGGSAEAEAEALATTEVHKFERVLGESVRFASRAAALVVPREAQFAPIKRGWGTADDSPNTARALLVARWKAMIEDAGGRVVGGGAGAPLHPVHGHGGGGGGGGGAMELLLPGAVEVCPLLELDRRQLVREVAGRSFSPPFEVCAHDDDDEEEEEEDAAASGGDGAGLGDVTRSPGTRPGSWRERRLHTHGGGRGHGGGGRGRGGGRGQTHGAEGGGGARGGHGAGRGGGRGAGDGRAQGGGRGGRAAHNEL